ncbi:MAG TPA: hypothetical protein VIX19_15285 [Terriglobales bacterium]
MQYRLLKPSRVWILMAPLMALAIIATTAAAQQPEEKFQRSFTLKAGGTLRVENYKGTIHVTGSNTDQVVVNVVKRFEGGNESEHKWWIENTKVSFSNDSNRIVVKVEYPNWSCLFCWTEHNFADGVELEIQAPAKTNLELEGYKPDIQVSSLEGNIRIKSYKAPMRIESTDGAIHIDTYKDIIQLKNVAVRGELEVTSYKAETEIDARSLEGSANLETEKGSIVLRVPKEIGLDVDFSGGRRSVFRSDFALASRAGAGYGHDTNGIVNGGGAHISLRTERGSITLEKRAGEL